MHFFAPIIIFICIFLHVFRGVEYFTRATFWAEDAVEFYSGARGLGVIEGVITPYNGYFHLLPRSIAEILTIFPIEYAAFVAALFSLLQLIPVFYFVSQRSNSFLPSKSSKCLMSLLYVLAPGSMEVHATITNLQWWGAVVICTVLSCKKPESLPQKFFDFLIVFFFSFSGVSSLAVLASVLFLRAFEKFYIYMPFVVLLSLASITQVTTLLFSARRVNDVETLDYLSLFELYIQRAFFQPILGVNGVSKIVELWRESLSAFCVSLCAFTLLVAFFCYLYRRCHHFYLLQILSGTAFVVMFSQSMDIPFDAFLFYISLGSRYFFPLSIALTVSLPSLLVGAEKNIQSIGFLFLFIVMTIGVPLDYLNNRNSSSRVRSWRDEIKRKFKHLPEGASAEIKIAPHWSVKVTKGQNR